MEYVALLTITGVAAAVVTLYTIRRQLRRKERAARIREQLA